MKESEIQHQVMDYLGRMGFLVIRTNAGKIYHKGHMIKLADAGTSDLIACSPEGVFWAIEIKTAEGKVTQKQLDFLYQVHRRGGIDVIIRGENWHEDIRAIMQKRRQAA
jgi:hypothetical protein